MPNLPRTKPFPWKCGHCRARAVQPAIVPYTTEAEYDGRAYEVTVPELKVPRCESCGELVLDTAANRQISEALRQQLRLLTPERIRANREALGLTQRQLACHLGLAEATLSRWETGAQIQQRALDRLLRLYFSSPATREVLTDEKRLAELGTSLGGQTNSEAESSPGGGGKELLEAVPSEPSRGFGSAGGSRTVTCVSLHKDVQAVTQHLEPGAIQDALRRLLGACALPAERWEAAVPGLAELLRPLVGWSLSTDRCLLESWRGLFRARLAGASSASASPGAPDRWFVAPLCASGPEDTEQATRLSRLARALDALPSLKRESAVQEFQQLTELMK